MDRLTTLFGETRVRLLGMVRSGPRSIGELAAALGISDNAVRTHVAALERDGLVRPAGVARDTGGKPARRYEISGDGEELFPKAYALVLGALMRTLREEDGERAAEERLRRVGRRLASAAGEAGAPLAPEERVHAAAALLRSIGGDARVVREEGGWRLDASGCPLSGVVAAEPDACALAESLLREATGLPVEECCRRSGLPSCSFRVREMPGGATAAEAAPS